MPLTIPVKVLEPIEKIILDNEERSTTWAETGVTGLLLGTVKLPAPKTHQIIFGDIMASAEIKYVATKGLLSMRFYINGELTTTPVSIAPASTEYFFMPMFAYDFDSGPASYSLKGNATMEIRFYLIGSDLDADARQYCRNLVVKLCLSMNSKP